MLIYDFILQGDEATEENAMCATTGIDWQEIETSEINRPYTHSKYIDSNNGIDVYYDYGADYYYFVDVTEGEN